MPKSEGLLRSSLLVCQKGGSRTFFNHVYFFFPARRVLWSLDRRRTNSLKHYFNNTGNYYLTHFSSSKVGEEMKAPRVRSQPSSPDCSSSSFSSFSLGVRECVKRNSYMWRKLFNNCITILQQVNLLLADQERKGEEESVESRKSTLTHTDADGLHGGLMRNKRQQKSQTLI